MSREELKINEFDEEVVSDDDKTVEDYLGVTSDDFTLEYKRVLISELIYSESHKTGRQNTVSGLTTSVEALGVLDPVHIMSLESVDDDKKYLLISGLRRVYASVRAGYKDIPALEFKFNDIVRGKEISLLLGRVLSRSQKHTWNELWELIQVLELQGVTAPSALESVFDLPSGTVMQLKDVMLCKYEDIIVDLKSGAIELSKAVSTLKKYRREEDRLAEDETAGMGGQETFDKDTRLSDDEVRDLLDMEHSIVDLESDDFAEVSTIDNLANVQDVGDRKPVDPMIKNACLERAGFKCECCGIGGPAFLATLLYHHAIPVHAGGPDSVDNGRIVCDTDHILVHVVERSGGVLPVTKEQFDSYDAETQARLKKVSALGKLAYEAGLRKGKSTTEIKSDARKAIHRRMPGEGYADNRKAYYASSEHGDEE